MIEGLHFDVSSAELKAHCAKQVRLHTERVEFYEGNIANLEAGAAEAHQYTNGDPIKNLRESLNGHRNKAEVFTWLHDHVIEGEVYRLAQSDLEQIGIVRGRYM